MILNKENTFTENNRFLVYSDQLNATRKQILDETEEMISRAAIQTFEDEGETVTATDASYLASLTVDGKAVQDGTPTPSNPIPIQVVGLNSDNEFGIQIGETLYPIDLQGNVLASLPDGTKDVLTVDNAGHCVLTKRVGMITVGVPWNSVYSFSTVTGGARWYVTPGAMSSAYSKQIPEGSENGYSTYTRFYRKSSLDSVGNHMYTYDNRVYYVISGITSSSDAVNWVNSHNATVVYPLATTKTIDLGYISMPAIPDGATISITSSVTPTIAAKWWTKNQGDVAAAFSAVSSNLAALDARVTALESANAKSLVLEKTEGAKELASEPEETDEQEEIDEQEEMNLDEE